MGIEADISSIILGEGRIVASILLFVILGEGRIVALILLFVILGEGRGSRPLSKLKVVS